MNEMLEKVLAVVKENKAMLIKAGSAIVGAAIGAVAAATVLNANAVEYSETEE